MNYLNSIAIASLAALTTACGGGGNDSGKNIYANYTCSMFSYQTDAQAAYVAGASQLDGDKDGKACEELPDKPYIPPSIQHPVFGLYTGTLVDGKPVEGVIYGDGRVFLRYLASNGTSGIIIGDSTLLPGYKFNAQYKNYYTNSQTPYTTTGSFSDNSPAFFKTAAPYAMNLTLNESLQNTPVPVLGSRFGTLTEFGSNQPVDKLTITFSTAIFSTADRSGARITGKFDSGCTFSGYMENKKELTLINATYNSGVGCKNAGNQIIGYMFVSRHTGILTGVLDRSTSLLEIHL